jgi:hypothetical protein
LGIWGRRRGGRGCWGGMRGGFILLVEWDRYVSGEECQWFKGDMAFLGLCFFFERFVW